MTSLAVVMALAASALFLIFGFIHCLVSDSEIECKHTNVVEYKSRGLKSCVDCGEVRKL